MSKTKNNTKYYKYWCNQSSPSVKQSNIELQASANLRETERKVRELERREEEMEIQVSGEQQLVGPSMVRMVVMHTVPQEGQKRPALNSTNDCAKKIPLFF